MAREKIVELMGDLPRIELFARQSPADWDVWGNQVDSSLSLKIKSHIFSSSLKNDYL
ncbi:hypothetical protein [Oceanobacillus sojae]|uniref:hypothetical protein n=1 Tax=Oceanobacillus sojae TaxID=582851 RepID=UPI003F742865